MQENIIPRKVGYILPEPKQKDRWAHDLDTVKGLLKYWRPDDSKFSIALKEEMKTNKEAYEHKYLSFEHDSGGLSILG